MTSNIIEKAGSSHGTRHVWDSSWKVKEQEEEQKRVGMRQRKTATKQGVTQSSNISPWDSSYKVKQEAKDEEYLLEPFEPFVEKGFD